MTLNQVQVYPSHTRGQLSGRRNKACGSCHLLDRTVPRGEGLRVMSLVAVVEPDEAVRLRVVRALREADLTVVEAAGGLEALRVAFSTRPQAVVMDAHARDIEGLELVRVLRAACDVPILVLAADPKPRLTVQLLDCGADDVLGRGCIETELAARVQASIRRYERQPSDPVQSAVARTGDLVVDRESQIVTKRGRRVPLSRTEYRLMDALASRPGQLVPHRLLLSTVWGDAYVNDTHYLRLYIGYLRSKLEDDPSEPRYLTNEWGMGYRLMVLPLSAPVGADMGAHPKLRVLTTAAAPDGLARSRPGTW